MTLCKVSESIELKPRKGFPREHKYIEGESDTTINASEFNRLWTETNRATQDIRAIIDQMLLNQGNSSKAVLSIKEVLILDEKTRAATKYAISENGESGIKPVSDRIIAFAKSIPKVITRKYIAD